MQFDNPTIDELVSRMSPRDLDLALEAAECQRDLLRFAEIFWHVNDPMEPFVNGWPIQAIADHLMAVSDGHIKRLIINVPPGFSKATWDETIVTMGDGSRKRLADVRVGDLVITKHGRARAVLGVHVQGELDSLKITTDTGRVVIAEPDHPFLTPEGWVRAGDLVVSQMVAVRGIRSPTVAKTREDAEFLLAGYFVGDGCVTFNGNGSLNASVSATTEVNVSQIIDCARSLGWDGSIARRANKITAVNITGGRRRDGNGVRGWLREIGLAGQNSYTKRVPPFVFAATDEQTALFLAAYFQCDGCVHKKGQDRKRFCISFASVAEPLLRDVQSLLARFGINARLRKRVAPTDGKFHKAGYVSWTLDLYREHDAAKFLQRIPVIGAKHERLRGYQPLRRNFDDDVLADEIVTIEPVGKFPCRCLTVEEDASFLANDVIVHNSLLTDVFWPAWEWGPLGRSSLRYIAAAYTASLTQRDNGRFLRVLLDDKYRLMWGRLFNLVKIGAKKVENDRTGWKLATSVEGYGTGERGNRVIMDDPNNPKDVESDLVREGTNLWLREVMPDRLTNLKEGAIILIQQRTHQHDCSGTLLDVMGQDYVLLMVPMEYDPTRHCYVKQTGWHDPRGLDENGELLEGFGFDADGEMTQAVEPGTPAAKRAGSLAWKARFPLDVVEKMARDKGEYAYTGQYQQSPSPRGGGLIKRDWWRLWPSETFPDFGTTVVSLDTAIKEKEINKSEPDWNAITVWSAFGDEDEHPQLMLRFAARMRGSLGEVVKMCADACQKYKTDYLLIEDKTRGNDVAGEIRTQFGTRAWSTLLLNPTDWGISEHNKIARVVAVQPLFSGDVKQRDERSGFCTWTGGIIWAPEKEWSNDVIAECENFPRGAHDDYVDTVSQALLFLRRTGVVLRKVEWDEEQLDRKKLERMKQLPALYPA